ncbi:acyl-CoA dehydrogenase family protein [Alcaligenaceae bacterium]|nr:acyl-CoA dehydrogenase family protein [Alcaligenaceae bacterium]
MHSAASEDQQLLLESVRRFLQANPSAAINSLSPGTVATTEAGLRWRNSAAQGWLQVLVPEEHGGLGLSTLDAAAMAEEMGQRLLDLPVSQAMAFAGLLAQVALDEDNNLDALKSWLDGSRYCAIAVKEVGEPDNWAEYVCAEEDVLATGWADGQLHLEIQRARHSGQGLDPFIATASLTRPGEAHVNAAWELPCTSRDWRQYKGRSRALRLAELLGVSSAALNKAVAHACEREQFGKPIGVNQAVKHALADNWMALDNARLVLHDACVRLDDELGPENATLYLLMAELLVLEASTATAQAIQTHGALGVAWESGLHLYLRRAHHCAAVLQCHNDTDTILEQIWALSDS